MGANFSELVIIFDVFTSFFGAESKKCSFRFFGCVEDPNYYGDLVDVVLCQMLKDDSNI